MALVARTDAQFESRFREAFEGVKLSSRAMQGPSLAERYARLPKETREQIWDDLQKLPHWNPQRLLYAWDVWGRPKQLIRTMRRIILALGGRGSGKSKTASNWLRRRIEQGARTVFIAGPTLADIGKYQIHGESGLIAAFPPHQRPIHREDKRLVLFPWLPGVECHIITAEEPEWRGANVDSGWWDEPAKSRYRDKMIANIELSLRSASSGLDVQIMISGTPLPIALLKELVLDPECLTVLSSSDENASNLESRTLARWHQRFGNTRLGKQEMDGEILSDNPGALFTKTKIEEQRVDTMPSCVERAIAIDPGVGIRPENDPTAMVAGGIDSRGHIYITAAIAKRWTPEQWGAMAISFADVHHANATVLETNRDSDIIAANVRNAYKIAGRKVPQQDHEKRGGIQSAWAHVAKGERATPVQALMEQNRIHFVGVIIDLENEITEWDPSVGGKSPNLLDAFVWLVWYLARLDSPTEPDYEGDSEGIEDANREIQNVGAHQPSRAVDRFESDYESDAGGGDGWDGRV